MLLVGEVGHRAGGALDGDVEAVEFLEVGVAVEGLAGHGEHDLLDLGRDYVAADEFGVVEDFADEAFGEDVLDEHLIDGGLREVGVEAAAAEVEEVGEGLLEGGVGLVGLVDLLLEALGEVGDALFELIDGLLELLDLGLDVAEELEEEFGEGGRVFHVGREDELAGLVEDGGLVVLEDDVGEGVAGLAFLCYFGVQVVVGVFGFPIAADEVEGVFEGSVGADGFAVGPAYFLLVLGDECPVVLLAGGGEEGVEGRAGAHFVHDVLVGEVGEIGIVLDDELGELGFGARGAAG